MSDVFTFWVGNDIYGVPSPIPMVLSPHMRRPEFKVKGAAPAVLGGFTFANRELIVVDLRVLFGTSTELTKMTSLVVVDYLGTRYALMVDSLDTTLHFDREVEEEGQLELSSLAAGARPYVASVLSGTVGGVRKELYRLNLSQILAPATLMVN